MTAQKSVFSIEIEAPREVVWQRLTEPGKRQPFYFNSVLDIALEVGGPLRYRSTSGRVTFIDGEVLELDAPGRFAHTFRFADLREPHSTVTFQLTATDNNGTRLTVTHVGPEATARTFARVQRGWPSILANLRAWIEHGALPLKNRIKYALMGLMLPFFPKAKGAAQHDAKAD